MSLELSVTGGVFFTNKNSGVVRTKKICCLVDLVSNSYYMYIIVRVTAPPGINFN